MFKRLPLRLRSAAYALRGGFLVRPLLIAIVLGLCGAVLSSVEEANPKVMAWVPTTLFPSRDDPQVALAILSVIATSIMTIVSIVWDWLKIGGQAASAIGGKVSFAGWNFCP
jgi:hypothetical protein